VHSIRYKPLPISGQLVPNLFCWPFSRYLHFPISGTRPWSFGVTWRHRSCDHWTSHTPFPFRLPLWPSVYLQPFSRYWSSNIMRSRPWPFKVTWRQRSRVHSIRHKPFPINGQLVPTEPLSLTVFEILAFSYIWVTTLTFWGHVTSSVMWPFDSAYPISYSSSIVTKCVSPVVFEIFSFKLPDQCKSSLRMRDITWPVPPMQNLCTYFNFPPHIAYSLWHFYWAPMRNKRWLLLRPQC